MDTLKINIKKFLKLDWEYNRREESFFTIAPCGTRISCHSTYILIQDMAPYVTYHDAEELWGCLYKKQTEIHKERVGLLISNNYLVPHLEKHEPGEQIKELRDE